MNKILAAVLVATAATLAHADTSPAKKALIAKVLQLQQPAIEAQARALAERPAAAIMQSVGAVIQQRVPLEKREPLIKDIQGDLRKFVDDTAPLLREHAVRLLPQTSGAVLDAKFSEAELKQLLGALEAPAFRKYQQANDEMFRPLADKLGQEVRPEMEPRLRALEQNIRKRLEVAVGAPAAPAKP
ncbi:hypothetical protein [Pseudorhodoferax sp.]|uniref:hypothetical protein n=1 Tax=Pseudorhodoferax sp. TaxID=1993553 RepID=UPI002DD6983C|nr:hypothetical protein [Pseudorhodoferax sp.]